jgi:asparagine synthetase B (glutamine-hydrolysing)
VVKSKNTPCLLFSGGLDTSILASIDSAIKGITVRLTEYGEDKGYASQVAGFLILIKKSGPDRQRKSL